MFMFMFFIFFFFILIQILAVILHILILILFFSFFFFLLLSPYCFSLHIWSFTFSVLLSSIIPSSSSIIIIITVIMNLIMITIAIIIIITDLLNHHFIIIIINHYLYGNNTWENGNYRKIWSENSNANLKYNKVQSISQTHTHTNSYIRILELLFRDKTHDTLIPITYQRAQRLWWYIINHLISIFHWLCYHRVFGPYFCHHPQSWLLYYHYTLHRHFISADVALWTKHNASTFFFFYLSLKAFIFDRYLISVHLSLKQLIMQVMFPIRDYNNNTFGYHWCCW